VDGGSFEECSGLKNGSSVSDVVYWREHNARCFEDTSRSFEEILHDFLFTLYTWVAGWLAQLLISFRDFLSHFSSPP
jgi:hypothetical protein